MENVSSSNGLEKYPKLRFPGFGEPWKTVRLSDVTSFRRQRAKSPKNAYVSTENLLQNFEGIVAYLDKDEVEGIAFMPGDTLLANIRPYLKKAWLASFEGICSADVLAFSPEKITASFLYGIIARDCFIEYVMGGVKGSKMPRGDKAHILEYEFAIPEKSEQEKISAFIASIDHRIKKQREMIDVLKKYKRGFISEVLKQKLILSREGEKWEEVSLSDVADGFEYGMNAAATSFDGEHKYIRITDIDDDAHTYIASAPVSPSGDLEEKYRVRENDILFARTGASVGKSYLYRKTDGDLFFAGFLIRIHVKEGVDSGYVFLNTLTEDYDKWVLLESARSGQPGINAEQYKRYSFKLPPLKIQKQISGIAQKMDEQIKREYLCLRLLQKQRDGMLQQLFI